MNKKPIKILLADDDEDDRLFFKEAIDELNLNTELTIVEDGEKLMNNLLDPTIEMPHVIFLDLNMPCKSGMECLSEIRDSELLASLTVAIYSTSSSEEDIEQSFVKGANIYIKKPNDFESLKKVLNRVITTNWQYFSSGMNKENFLLSI
ncbi:response regulator [Pararhodonellum marinum]|uniref:response regulator n=1 Tax=Pararhodonellum marinum TaxID=2755358 RepID=UPI00188E1DAA|nr:response regulator [Pararhodonellum marinum]